MAGSTNRRGFYFPPYEDDGDQLDERKVEHLRHMLGISASLKHHLNHMVHIPPSVGVSYEETGDSQSAEEQEKRADLLTRVDQLVDESGTGDIAEWIEACRSLKLELDIDRLARFAVYRNSLAVLAHLVEHEDADLTRRDILGRSAIFYAMRRFPDRQMLMYVALKMRQGSTLTDLDHQDANRGRTPLHYAVTLDSLDAVELLLAMDANTEIKCKSGKKPRDFLGRTYPFETIHLSWCMGLLFEFKTLLQYQTRIYKKDFGINLSEQSLGQLQDDLKLTATEPIESNDTQTWLHIPWTNGIVIFSVLRRYGRDIEDPTYAVDEFSSLLRGSITTPPHCDLPYSDPFYRPSENFADQQVSIVFPCLVLRTKESQIRARGTIEDLKKDMIDDFARTTVLPERTLDETYFPSLPEDALGIRNNTQVVTREFSKPLTGVLLLGATEPILMVSQLWLWRRDGRIFTASSGNVPGVLVDKEGWGLRYLVPDWNHTDPSTTFGLLIAHYMSEFSRTSSTERFGSPFDIFESSVVHVLADVDTYITSRPFSRPEMETERDFMFRIADIREELAMIQQVLGQQLEILQSLIADAEKNTTDGAPQRPMQRWKQVKSAVTEVKKYQKRAEKIDSDAERVERRIQDQLNLRRTHVSIEDARVGLILSRASLVTSTAVIGFTVITIIFAPLAFVTALFALPIDILLRNQLQFDGAGDDSGSQDGMAAMGAYSTRYVATWFIVAEVVSLIVTGLLVVLCLWLLGSTKSFAALQESSSRQADDASVYTPSEVSEAMEIASSSRTSASESGRERVGLRRRVANIFDRNSKGILSSDV
ncbi:hypothetical protein F5Y14DRAFT_422023 [Nemania sp. NC0429]|nr:hypothetical protein F5Y14DRAFT_422023 [Nemania sp. NC0429]